MANNQARPATQATAPNQATAAPTEDDDERDTRVRRDPAVETRGDRVAQDAAREELDTLMSVDDFDRLMRDEFEQNVLPSPPPLKGYHLCWLTTSSSYDSVSKRQRLGYRPVSRAEMPSFDPSSGHDVAGDFTSYITCNEMVLHKIPEQFYQRMMVHFHHKRPLEDEQNALGKIKAMDERDSSGRDPSIIEGDGLLELERTAKRESVRHAPAF